jgi:hypothetical protein
MVIALLLAAVSLIVLVACLQHARTEGWKAPGLKTLRPRAPRSQPVAPRAAADLPPAGLAPLIPSPRALAHEFERGLRELTFFLAVQGRD